MDLLIQICNAFLITNGLILAALGAAETNNDKLKVGLSAAGLLISALWLISAHFKYAELESYTIYGSIFSWLLPVAFAIGWIVSLYFHIKNTGWDGRIL